MPLSIPILIGADTLTQANRWRLVDGLYARFRPAIEGTIAIIAVAAIGWARSHAWGFGAVVAMSPVILAARTIQHRSYRRTVRDAPGRPHTPEIWAHRYMVSSVINAACWPMMHIAATASADPMLELFVLTAQSGWLGATCTRNAASPANAVAQALLIIAPADVCLVYSNDHFLHWMAIFAALQLAATLGITRAASEQIAATLIIEQRLEEANARLMELSATDGLTGIANRRGFDAALHREWGRAAREGTDLALLIIDVDHFKAFNDWYGHPAGDECLRLIAGISARMLRRPPDIAARFGGEEFAALLPGTGLDGAMEVAERLRDAVVAQAIAHSGTARGIVTISIGAASIAPHPGNDSQVLIAMADSAVYRAKHEGRNRVCPAAPALGAWTNGSQILPPAVLGEAGI